MNILIVTNPEAVESIHVYSARCTDDILFDVEQSLEELGIEVSVEVVETIANEMRHGRNYWLNETYCFEVIPV